MASEVCIASEVPMAAEVPISAMSANMRSTFNVRSADVSTHDKSPLQLLTAVGTSLLPLQLPKSIYYHLFNLHCQCYYCHSRYHPLYHLY